jgi:hypothetical protein
MHCEPFRHESGKITGFACGAKRPAKPCAFCGVRSTHICDGKWMLGTMRPDHWLRRLFR